MEQTKLLQFIINPDFIELMKQPISSVEISSWFSFDVIRNGRKLHFTMYADKDGQVNISDVSNGGIGNVIIRDFCKTAEDFASLLVKLDDLLIRMPKLNMSNHISNRNVYDLSDVAKHTGK